MWIIFHDFWSSPARLQTDDRPKAMHIMSPPSKLHRWGQWTWLSSSSYIQLILHPTSSSTQISSNLTGMTVASSEVTLSLWLQINSTCIPRIKPDKRAEINGRTPSRVTTKFPRQNSRKIQGYFKDLCMIFKDVKSRQKHQDSMLRYYNVPPKKKITKEYSHMLESTVEKYYLTYWYAT